MKPSFFRSNPFFSATGAYAASVFVTLSSVGIQSAAAADASWNVDAAGTWVTDANWNPALAPGTLASTTNPDTATFGAVVTVARAITVDAGRNVAGINFNGNSFAYTLNGGSLVLSAGGLIQTSGAGTAHTDTISTPISLVGNATFSGDSATAARLLALATVSGSSTGNSLVTLTGATTGNNVVTGVISNGAGFTTSVNKDGAGTWMLGGASTYSGGTTLTAGTLIVNSSSVGNVTSGPLGIGAITLVGGVLNSNGGGRTVANPIAANGSTGFGSSGGDLTFTGAITGSGTLSGGALGGSSVNFQSDLSAFTGTFNHSSTNGGTNFLFSNAAALNASQAKFLLSGASTGSNRSVAINLNGGTLQMGELSGTSGIISASAFNGNLGGTIQVGALNTNSTYGGAINNNGTGVGRLNKVGTGTLTLSGSGNFSGLATVSGGTIVVTGATALGNTSGATSVASGATVDLQANVGAEPFTITGNGATGNGVLVASTGTGTSSGAITLASDSQIGGAGNLVLNGPLGGDFGITKTGAGTLTLGGSNGYTGGTIISGGTLTTGAAGSIASSFGITLNGSGAKFLQTNPFATAPSVTVTQGTLEAVGTVGAVSVAAGVGNVITTNNSNGSPLATGTLSFGGAATLNLTTSSLSPVISATDLTTTTAGIVVNVSNASWADGSYPLISYSTFTGAVAHFTKGTIPNLGARQTSEITNSGTSIDLVIGGVFPIWTGTPNGNWTTSVNTVPTNWKLNSNGNPDNFRATDAALFDDSATGTTTVNISAGNVSPISTTFTNSVLDYTLTGTAGIATGSLSKSGTGPLTIQNANTYPGGTFLTDGTLNLNNASAIGTGTLSIGGSGIVVIDNTSGAPITLASNNSQQWNGDFTFTGTNALNLGTGPVTLGGNRFITIPASELTVGGVISGLFSLNKSGPGTLVLTGANTYSGGTNINEGTLRGTTTSIPGTVVNNGAVIFDQAADGTYAGAMSGIGTLTKLNNNILTLSGNSSYSGGTTLTAGTLQLNSGNGAGSGSITLGGNTVVMNFNANNNNALIGSGTVNMLAGTTNNVALNGDLSGFTGVINVPLGPVGGTAKVAINAGASGDLTSAATINVASGGTFYTQTAGVVVGATINVSGTGNPELLGALRVDFDSELSGTINLLGDTAIGGTGAANTSGTISGGITGAFGITKVRALGAINLNGTNTYTGPTVVSAGILRVNGSTSASSAVSVSAGATLAGAGTVGGTVTTAGSNSVIAPGNAGIGTLSTGTTSLTGVLATELNATLSDQLNINGNLTLVAGATLTVSQLAPATASKYVLVKYTGTLTGTFPAPVLPPGYSISYDATAKEISIVKSGFNGFMDGFALSAADKLATADPDKDGVSNLLEYALAGFDPTVSNASPGTLSGGILSFAKRALAVSNGDVTYAIEESTTLGLAPDPWAVVVTSPVNDPAPITYSLPVGQAKEFARLKVSQNP